MNADAISYQSKTPEKCMETSERENNRNYLYACLNERRHFTTRIALVDSLLGIDLEATLKRIASHLAQKWKEPYSRTYGYVKSRVDITLLRATHRCIREGSVPESLIIVTRPQWEDGAGIHLFR